MAITIWPVDAKNGAPQYAGRGLRQTTVGVPLAGATSARPLGVRSGVRPGTPTNTVAVSGSTVTVRPHAGVLDVQAAVEASGYEYSVDAAVTVSSSFAQDQSNPRTDIVWVQVADPSEGNGTAPGITFGYTAGAASGTPATPTLPDRSMLLARLNVPKAGAGSPTVTWVAPTLVAAGGVVPVRSVAELNAVAGSAGAYADLTANADDATYGLGLYRFDGSKWTFAGTRSIFTQFNSESPLSGVAPIFQTGVIAGTTTSTGTLSETFNTAFPNGIIGVWLQTLSTSGVGSQPPTLVTNSVSSTGFTTFWASAGSASVRAPYLAIGY